MFWNFKDVKKNIFFKFLKNYVGVFKVTSLSGWGEAKLLEFEVSLWNTFLFIMNVSFIWCILGSQLMLSFYTVRPFYFLVDSPSYFLLFEGSKKSVITFVCSSCFLKYGAHCTYFVIKNCETLVKTHVIFPVYLYIMS